MDQQILIFEVKNCPIGCDEPHSYKVQIRTIPTFGGKSTPGPAKQQNERVYKADLLVVCPTKGEEYQVTVEIPYAQGQKVVNIKVEPDDKA